MHRETSGAEGSGGQQEGNNGEQGGGNDDGGGGNDWVDVNVVLEDNDLAPEALAGIQGYVPAL